ncbi:hypothetical protein Hanom_Chr04g00381201 [Helianthus anomalus]
MHYCLVEMDMIGWVVPLVAQCYSSGPSVIQISRSRKIVSSWIQKLKGFLHISPS